MGHIVDSWIPPDIGLGIRHGDNMSNRTARKKQKRNLHSTATVTQSSIAWSLLHVISSKVCLIFSPCAGRVPILIQLYVQVTAVAGKQGQMR